MLLTFDSNETFFMPNIFKYFTLCFRNSWHFARGCKYWPLQPTWQFLPHRPATYTWPLTYKCQHSSSTLNAFWWLIYPFVIKIILSKIGTILKPFWTINTWPYTINSCDKRPVNLPLGKWKYWVPPLICLMKTYERKFSTGPLCSRVYNKVLCGL